MDKKTRLSASIVAGLASFLAPFMGSAVNIALPSIGRRFGADPVILGWVATAYLLAAAVFLVPFGRLADIHGRRKVFVIGISVYTGSSLLTALAPSMAALIAFRVFQGFGAALIFGTAIAILTSVFPPGERGKVLGINTAAVYLGLSLGPVIGGWLTQQFGWRSIFLFNIPLGLVIIVLVLSMLRQEWAESKGERFDFRGSVLYGLALVGIMLGFSLLPQLLGVCLLLAGLSLICGFICQENRATSPVINLSLFRLNRVFAFSNLAALINYSATFAVGFFLSLYLQYLKGMTPQSAGLILIAQPVIMTAFSPLAGRASDRVEPRVVASLGMGVSSAGLLLLALLHPGSSLGFVVASLAVLGFGFALFSSPNINAVMSSVEKKHYGIASATLGTMRLVGQMFSMGMAIMIFAVFIGRIEVTAASEVRFLQAIKSGFAVFSALCFAGIFASLARGNRSQPVR